MMASTVEPAWPGYKRTVDWHGYRGGGLESGRGRGSVCGCHCSGRCKLVPGILRVKQASLLLDWQSELRWATQGMLQLCATFFSTHCDLNFPYLFILFFEMWTAALYTFWRCVTHCRVAHCVKNGTCMRVSMQLVGTVFKRDGHQCREEMDLRATFSWVQILHDRSVHEQNKNFNSSITANRRIKLL